jgi:hypothetical protein
MGGEPLWSSLLLHYVRTQGALNDTQWQCLGLGLPRLQNIRNYFLLIPSSLGYFVIAAQTGCSRALANVCFDPSLESLMVY